MGEIRVKSEIPYTDGWKRGAYAYANGNYTASATAYVCSEKIPCEHNANYNFVCTLPDGSKDHGFLFWDKNGVFLGEIHNTAGAQTSPVSFTVETPTNCAVLAINISTPTGYGNRYTEDVLSFDLYSWQTLPSHEKTSDGWKDIPTHTMTATGWQGELTSQSPLKFWADGEMLDWRVEGRTSGNLFDIGKNVNDYERAYTIISVDGSSISMKYEGSGMTFHYRTHNITTTGTVTIYCKGSKAKPQLFVRLRSMDNTKWLTNSDVTISGMAYNIVYNGWFSYAMGDTFIKTIIIPECLYWNMGVGFNSGGTKGEAVTISNPMVISGTYTSSTIPPYEPYGGVGDWDETEQRYKIPVTVNGVTTNIYTDHQLLDGDSIDFTTDQTAIPIATGNNTLTVDTAVQPKSVFVKFEG